MVSNVNRLSRALVYLLTVAILISARWTHAADRVWSIVVVPQFPAVEMHKRWSPVIEYIKTNHGVELELKTPIDIPTFETSFMQGLADFSYMNPYHAVMAKRAQGYIPLVRDGSTQLNGILVVRKDSQIRQLGDLRSKEIAFPAPNSFGASLYMRALLTEQFAISFTPKYVDTHTNVVRAVILGQAVAGGVVGATYNKEPPEVKDQVRVLFETPGVSPHPISAHPRVPANVRETLANAFIKMAVDKPELLSGIQIPSPIRANYTLDYQPLEKLKLEKFVVLEIKR